MLVLSAEMFHDRLGLLKVTQDRMIKPKTPIECKYLIQKVDLAHFKFLHSYPKISLSGSSNQFLWQAYQPLYISHLRWENGQPGHHQPSICCSVHI